MKRYVRCASRTEGREFAQDPAYRWNVARNPSTPADILAELANDEDDDVRGAVAENPNTPADILAELANDEEVYVRYIVAANPNTPADTLAELAADKDDEIWNVRTRVAKNPSTPANVLRQLANDTNTYVRKGVAANPNAPADLRKSFPAYTPSASSKPKAMTWKRLVADLEAEAEDGIDSIYEQTEAGEALEGVCAEVEKQLGVWLEPSIQGGQGSIDILSTDDDTRLGTLDFGDYTYEVCNMAASCSSKNSFKQQYAEYLDLHMSY